MDERERDDFLAGPWVGVLATTRADGSPLALPVWYRWDGAAIKVWSDAAFPWVGRLADDPRLAFAVFEHEAPFRAVYVRGVATVRRGPLAALRDEIRPIVARYLPADHLERTIDAYDRGDDKVIVTLTPASIRAKRNLA